VNVPFQDATSAEESTHKLWVEMSRRKEATSDRMKGFYAHPLGFVKWAWRWGLPGPLEKFTGPDKWQEDFLIDLGEQVKQRNFNGRDAVSPIKMTASSGHGVGKTSEAAWINCWLLATRPMAQGTVTANTYTQLETKTWAAMMHWFKTSRVAVDFIIGGGSIRHRVHQKSWMCTPQTCREENSEAFAGQHAASSTSYYIFDEGCHDDQTEILSRRGWVLFKDLLPTDEVLTMDQKTNAAMYIKPVAIHSSLRRGEMLEYKTRGADFCVTPSHNMWVQSANGRTGVRRPWKFTRMGILAATADANRFMYRRINWDVPDIDAFTIPAFKSTRKLHPERTVNFDQWVSFLGWYCSEGHLVKRANSRGETEYTSVGITNQDLSKIKNICSALGFHACEYAGASTPQLIINDRALAEYLAQFGRLCTEKGVPRCVAESSARQINLFLDEYITAHNVEIIYTSSKRMAGDLQELCLKGGAQSSVRIRKITGQVKIIGDHTATSSCDGYVVSRAQTKSDIYMRTKHLKSKHYEGHVYCAELPEHHLLFTRRDGFCIWSGNSAVPDKIYEVAELGGLTDGAPVMLVFGNCTRNSGKFFRINFGNEKGLWNHRTVDARTCAMPNKTVHDDILKQYGEDSDQFRVRVLGLPPQASDIQFIDNLRVFAAQKRQPEVIRDEPLVAGVDCARGGSDKVVIRFRQGDDARSRKPIKIPGEQVRDSMLLVSKLSDLATQEFGEGTNKRKVDAWFVDSGNMGGPIVDRLHQLGFKNFIEVNFAGQCPDPMHYANMRVWMWAKMRDHLGTRLAIDTDQELEIDLTGPGITHDRSNRILLESKDDMQRRGLASQDDGDSLALSYAQTVTALSVKEKKANAWNRPVVTRADLPF